MSLELIIWLLTILFISCVIISLVPLHNPIDWLRFLINITRIPTFNSNSCRGNLLKLSVNQEKFMMLLELETQ